MGRSASLHSAISWRDHEVRPAISVSGLNALTCSVTAQLHQLVSELAQKLGRALANAATNERHLQRLVLIASQGNRPDANISLGQQIESDEAERLSEPSSEAAHELLELVRKEPERDARGLVEIADQLRPGEIHFFPKLQYAGKPLTAKSRLFRQGVDELVTQGWLFPPEEHPATNSRTYEYRGDTVLSKTVIIASEVSAPSGKRSSPYPAAVPVSGHPGIVLSPYARSTGYVDVRGYAPATLVKCPYTSKIFSVPGGAS